MNHGDAFFLVARDVMWFALWVSPFYFGALTFIADKSDSENIGAALLAIISYIVVSTLLFLWGEGRL